VHAPATAAARRWQGFGTALKPAWEPIIVARKPLDGTVAVNVQRHGTGGLNIDGCRVSPNGDMLGGGSAGASHAQHPGWRRPWMESKEGLRRHAERAKIRMAHAQALGRWPANLIHDGSEEVVAGFPRSDRASGPHIRHNKSRGTGRSKGYDGPHDTLGHGDSGSAARFFYCAKATKRDRDEGLEHMGGGKKAEVFGGGLSSSTRCVPGMHTPEGVANRPVHYNAHPTVKPTALMRYLCRLVTPPGGVILDPFMGSGSTGKAAMLEGFRFIGIDLDRRWVKIARCRIAAAARRGLLDLDPRRSTLALGRASVRLLASKTGQLASAAKAGGKAK
jgi:site-specific DNA-methyltransferase (adenine-specific)